ncbi:NHL repeat-containing protein [Hyalangium gracile]|uniref:hypothetical protein n=1 Tax=Hyalangium gracile TaxID=394092 RepID=UPI001CCF3438|nr:hypothetical protein [Hyalangium gracile]
MRSGWFGLVAVAALLTSCGDGAGDSEPTLQFRVGGTVSGLDGSITLQLNSGERLTLSQSGPFLFETPIDDGNPYRVAITTAPAEQVCTLKAPSGRIAGTDVDSVQATCVRRTYTLGGRVAGVTGSLQLSLDSGETLSVDAPSAFTFQTQLPRGSPYTVTLGTPPRGFRCALTGGSGTVAGPVTDITVQCTPWFALTTFQPAKLVLGQNDFTLRLPNQGDSTGYTTQFRPAGHPTLVEGRLYVSDSGNHRIVGFDVMPTANGPSASFFLGQIDFFPHSESAGPRGLARPATIAVEAGRMVVADRGNNRVVVHLSTPKDTFVPANAIVGQPDFLNISPRCDRRSLRTPSGVSLVQGKLVVADTDNHRVLIWNTLPTSHNAAADLVLGQPGFTSCVANDAHQDGTSAEAPTASTLSRPEGVWTDGTRLLVADTGNHRVLLWNPFPTTNGQPADLVLGQPGFTTADAATSATGMNAPNNVNSTGQQIFVSERGNNRITLWNQFPTNNGAAAELVLGQPDLTSRSRSDPPIEDPDQDPIPSARSLYAPGGVLLAAPYLVVTDTENHRTLIFESQ